MADGPGTMSLSLAGQIVTGSTDGSARIWLQDWSGHFKRDLKSLMRSVLGSWTLEATLHGRVVNENRDEISLINILFNYIYKMI